MQYVDGLTYASVMYVSVTKKTSECVKLETEEENEERDWDSPVSRLDDRAVSEVCTDRIAITYSERWSWDFILRPTRGAEVLNLQRAVDLSSFRQQRLIKHTQHIHSYR